MSAPRAAKTTEATLVALASVASWAPNVAVVFGSGLATFPEDVKADRQIRYSDLGWPCTAVEGHANELVLARWASPDGGELRFALAYGRPHLYEGWSGAELEHAVRALAGAGCRRFLFLNACGGLRQAPSGTVIVCESVVDLQEPPVGPEAECLPVCTAADAARVAAAVAFSLRPAMLASGRIGVGRYVAVCGPQFETPAEAAWLARFGDVVGMSAAPEVRASAAVGAQCLLLAAVANAAGGRDSHASVLRAAGETARVLSRGLIPAVLSRWPELATPRRM